MNRLLPPGFRARSPPQTNAFRRRVGGCAVSGEALPWTCPHSCCSSCISASAQGQLETKYLIRKRCNNSAFSTIQQRQQLTFLHNIQMSLQCSIARELSGKTYGFVKKSGKRNARHEHFRLRQSCKTGGCTL